MKPSSLAALAAALCLLVGCSSDPPSSDDAEPGDAPTSATSSAEPRADRSPSESSEPTAEPLALPARPSAARPGVLAQQFALALATLKDPDAPAADHRRAGEFQQLAARLLAHSDLRVARATTARLSAEHARIVRAEVAAGRALNAMTEPQPELPRWRIVAPAPAETLLRQYRAAGRRIGVPWTHLAAIHLVETRMGRIRGVSTAGARGPMQFLPTTWTLYGEGGDITDTRDSIFAAARLLRANGAPGDMADATWHYNPSDNYVRAVSEYAATLRRAPWVYRGYWQWRVLYKHVRGTFALEEGYPRTRPVRVPGD